MILLTQDVSMPMIKGRFCCAITWPHAPRCDPSKRLAPSLSSRSVVLHYVEVAGRHHQYSGTTRSSGRGALCPWLAPVQAAKVTAEADARCSDSQMPGARWCRMWGTFEALCG